MNKVTVLEGVRERRLRENQSRPAAIWPIKELAPATPSAWLRAAIDGKPYASVAQSLWVHHSNLKTATEKLGGYLTTKWPNALGQPLFAMSIENAVIHVANAVERGENFEGRVIGLYLHWLTNCVADVARVRVYGYTKSGEIKRWEYFSKPLQEWARKNGMTELEAHLVEAEPTQEQISGLRTHLLARITSNPVDAGYLEKYAPHG